jgi:hypothetical protein
MPMGLRNALLVHQRCVMAVLQGLIGKFCHIYLDDIVIWSDTLEEHTAHICEVLEALRQNSLYCNPKKCNFYLLELDFLGHHKSAWEIEANLSKVDRILDSV